MAKKDTTTPTDTSEALVVNGKAMGFLSETEDAFEGVAVSHMVSLGDIPGIRGIFEGPGETVEMADPADGSMREVPTWRVRVAKNVCFQFATSAQLDAKLKAYPIGEVVTIKKLPESRRSRAGRVVSQYLVSDPPKR